MCCWPCVDAKDAVSRTENTNARKVPTHTKHPKRASAAKSGTISGHHRGAKKYSGTIAVDPTERSALIVKDTKPASSEAVARGAIHDRTAQRDEPAHRKHRNGYTHARKRDNTLGTKVAQREAITRNHTALPVGSSLPRSPTGPTAATADSISRQNGIATLNAVEDFTLRKALPSRGRMDKRKTIPAGAVECNTQAISPSSLDSKLDKGGVKFLSEQDILSQEVQSRQELNDGRKAIAITTKRKVDPGPLEIKPYTTANKFSPKQSTLPREPQSRKETVATAVNTDRQAIDPSASGSKPSNVTETFPPGQDTLPPTSVMNILPKQARIIPTPQRRVTKQGTAGFALPLRALGFKKDLILPPQPNLAIKHVLEAADPEPPKVMFSKDPKDWFPQGMVGFFFILSALFATLILV